MRDDYDKLICERPRMGTRMSYKNVRRSTIPKDDDYSNLSNKESMRRPYGYERKQFNDYLNPLYRWMDKQVGRPWDKVQSDLHQMLDSRKTTDQHVWDHVKTHVEERVIKENGKYMSLNVYSGEYLPLWSGELFVWKGILRKNKTVAKKRYKGPKKEVQPVYMYEPDGIVQQYEKLGAMWHIVTYQWQVKNPGEYSKYLVAKEYGRDVVVREKSHLHGQIIGYVEGKPTVALLVHTGKRTLSKEEVVNAGLT